MRREISASKKVGKAPAIVLVNPKYRHNVGAAIRAASCFGVSQVWYTGDRIQLKPGERLPREERMKGYADVDLIQHNYPLDYFPKGTVPVAVELRPNAEPLNLFEHPENAVYCLGPEDGELPKGILNKCHRFVVIPTRHCVNLSAAIYLCLFDRLSKRIASGEEEQVHISELLNEERWWTPERTKEDISLTLGGI